MNPPCKGCTPETGRSDSCHPKCQKYLNWCDEQERKKKKINAEKTVDRLNHESRQRGFSIRRKFRKD